jgi:hypothetical protein
VRRVIPVTDAGAREMPSAIVAQNRIAEKMAQ